MHHLHRIMDDWSVSLDVRGIYSRPSRWRIRETVKV